MKDQNYLVNNTVKNTFSKAEKSTNKETDVFTRNAKNSLTYNARIRRRFSDIV
ncbi:hypothetical protein [Ruminococcus flavefaciens]|uniref:hypothetical protein n=1 Tax=Ruminococcus flavefaciens TaxID=1265 RepID=UPI0026EDE12F|nr:hypothetical protein [Ruminococcus flavefaciens]